MPPARLANAGALWNAAEAAERRNDAQVAREIVLALPANAELSTKDRVAMARSFAEQHFASKGLAVQLDVHARHPEPGFAAAETENEQANWHAHLLITIRRLEDEAFSAKKARDLDPEVRFAGGRARVRAASIAWASTEELSRKRIKRQAETSEILRTAARDDDSLRTKARDALAARQGPNAVHEKSQTPAAPAERATSGAVRQAEPAKTYWQSIAKEPAAARNEDSLRAKVRDSLAWRQQETATAKGTPEAVPAEAQRQAAGRNA